MARVCSSEGSGVEGFAEASVLRCGRGRSVRRFARRGRGFGLTEPIDAGGHRVMAMEAGQDTAAGNRQTELFAYRIR